MLAVGFINPLLLWALPLCAVPILIHLLNRRRFKKLPWAAMEFLLAAMKRNRKRLRMEQWLVLLLRTLAVAFVVLLVARPQLAGGSLLGGRTHHVVVLDDSGSMTQRMGSTNLFDHAQDRIRVEADRLGETRGGDLFSLLRTSRPTAPDLWAQRIGPDLGKRTGALLKQMTAGDGTMNLGEVLREVRRRAADATEATRTAYYLVTDLRAYDWLTEDSKSRSAIAAELLAMPMDREHLTVVQVGGHDSGNTAVTVVRMLDRVGVMGVPATLAVDVVNFGLDPSAATEVAVEVDGHARVVRPVEGLSPGQRATITITHTFHGPGYHRVEAALPPGDRFPLDDRRALALEVKDRSRVLLVDGDPGAGGEEAETYFASAALDPGGDAVSGIEPQVIEDLALPEADLAQFDAVWLCNVPAPVESVVRKLEAYVASGGGLVVFAGSQVEPARYGETLYRGGKGLLPLPFGELRGDPDRPVPMFLADRAHPIVARFPELAEKLLAMAVRVKRHLDMPEASAAPVHVLARVGDAEGSPVIVCRPFGSGGEVVQFGITADLQWSNWPQTYANVVILNSVHRFAARAQDHSTANLGTRGAYRLTLDPGLYKSDVRVRGLFGDGEERTFTAEEPKAGAEPPAPGQAAPALVLDVPMAELHGLGAFEVELRAHGDRIEKRMFARGAPFEESRLVVLAESALQRAYPPDALQRITIRREGTSAGPGTGEGELWYLLAAAMLAALLLESLLAWRFGRR